MAAILSARLCVLMIKILLLSIISPIRLIISILQGISFLLSFHDPVAAEESVDVSEEQEHSRHCDAEQEEDSEVVLLRVIHG